MLFLRTNLEADAACYVISSLPTLSFYMPSFGTDNVKPVTITSRQVYFEQKLVASNMSQEYRSDIRHPVFYSLNSEGKQE